ncbi:MAG: hypothetical protein R6X08_13090 [Desulfosalsimonadaceae bacterium]
MHETIVVAVVYMKAGFALLSKACEGRKMPDRRKNCVNKINGGSFCKQRFSKGPVLFSAGLIQRRSYSAQAFYAAGPGQVPFFHAFAGKQLYLIHNGSALVGKEVISPALYPDESEGMHGSRNILINHILKKRSLCP